ncbi:PREDICTED: protein NRT1/ PTR FAMILY 5.7 [Theobroma cacao]|uniref:Protein NRT1/ PTR FAMILY 5.7 n=1 Tax=Theobroma cacao TaxID=3641 RepID=A0AB32WER6_THECC|nr:PREDICTED: protein NRT1/ PTR FAMILY 5.7 [Theobroma cacao]
MRIERNSSDDQGCKAAAGNMFSKLGCVVTNWIRYHIYFSRGALFISGLVFSHGLAEHAVMCILTSYFMENWKKTDLRQAAAVVNVEEGASTIMAIIVSYISDAYFCRFKVIVYTTALCIIGLLLLGVSTWISPEVDVRLLYPVVILLAVGKAGRDHPLKAFIVDQLTDSKPNQAIDKEQVEARKNFWWRVAWSLGLVASFCLSTSSLRCSFFTSALVMAVAYLWFLSGINFYCYKKLEGSPLTVVYKVFKAAVLKRHLAYPTSANGYFKNDRDQLLLWPIVPFFRWLDKASIVESSSCQLKLEEQEITGRLCSAVQVKQVKCLLTLVPIWTTFAVYGLVEATGRTFFVAQANDMDDNIGSLSVVCLFLTLKSFVSFLVSFLLQLLIPKWLSGAKRQCIILVRIGLGMVFSIFSCIAAWQVEVHRMNLIKEEKFSDQYTRLTITITIFWLAPQFTLLGLMGGFAEDGIRDLIYNYHVADQSKKLHDSSFRDCTLAIGNFLNILFAFIFRAWFRDNINNSRLDKYFLMLAMLTIGNLCLYFLAALVWYRKFWPEEETQQEKVKLNLDVTLEDALTDSVTDNSLSNNFFYCTIINRLI